MEIHRPHSKQPIPPNAKIVFKGILFEVYQWEQIQYDDSVKVFEKIKRADTVSIIPVTIDGKFILTKQKQPGTQPFIGFPGGIIDTNELPMAAAERELLEETGYRTKNITLWFATQPTSKIDWAVYIFIAKQCENVQDQRTDSGEIIELDFVTFEELAVLITVDNFRDTEIALKMFKMEKQYNSTQQLRKLFLS